MQDASFSAISTSRLNDLIDSISEARRSLEEWQNQKTEALIRLDSFSYDIQKIEEERNRMAEGLEGAKRESENESRIYQGQIAELTDQLQMLKFELEGMKGQCTEKDLSIDALKKEIGNQDRVKEQLIAQNTKNLAELEALFEKRQEELRIQEKKIQENLGAQLSEMTQRKVEAETKIERLERDLGNIRTQMLGILHPQAQESGKSVVRLDSGTETHTIQSISKSDTTVDDYLKRLGY
jgi:chromosome segregation ATPase